MARRKKRHDETPARGRAPRGHDSVRVDRPQGLFSDPHAFAWASSLAIGWSAFLDRLVPQRRTPHAPAEPRRRGDKEE